MRVRSNKDWVLPQESGREEVGASGGSAPSGKEPPWSLRDWLFHFVLPVMLMIMIVGLPLHALSHLGPLDEKGGKQSLPSSSLEQGRLLAPHGESEEALFRFLHESGVSAVYVDMEVSVDTGVSKTGEDQTLGVVVLDRGGNRISIRFPLPKFGRAACDASPDDRDWVSSFRVHSDPALSAPVLFHEGPEEALECVYRQQVITAIQKAAEEVRAYQKRNDPRKLGRGE